MFCIVFVLNPSLSCKTIPECCHKASKLQKGKATKPKTEGVHSSVVWLRVARFFSRTGEEIALERFWWILGALQDSAFKHLSHISWLIACPHLISFSCLPICLRPTRVSTVHWWCWDRVQIETRLPGHSRGDMMRHGWENKRRTSPKTFRTMGVPMCSY